MELNPPTTFFSLMDMIQAKAAMVTGQYSDTTFEFFAFVRQSARDTSNDVQHFQFEDLGTSSLPRLYGTLTA